MLTISRVIVPPSLTKMYKKKAPKRICSSLKDQDLKSLNSSFFNVPRTSQSSTSLEKSIKMIGIIKKAIVIVAFAEPDL